MEADINYRIGKAAAVFQKMYQIWSAKIMHTAVKICLYNGILMPTVTNASKVWNDTGIIGHKLDVFHSDAYAENCVSYHDHVTNNEILHRANLLRLQDIVAEKKMCLARHLLCLPNH